LLLLHVPGFCVPLITGFVGRDLHGFRESRLGVQILSWLSALQQAN
jgi:hypothetical protein